MSQHPEVVNEIVKTLLEYGSGSGGTRNISGTSTYHTELEKKLANVHNKEAALVFASAYTANQSTLWTLGKKIKDIEIFSDELNHASLIQGIKNSGAKCHIFKHNDIDHLEQLLKESNVDNPKLIVFESLYSMEGIRSPIVKIVELAKKYNCMTYLDEVHSVTTSICPSIAAGAAKAIDIVSLAEQLRIRIKENAALIRENLDSLAIPYLDTNSHIVAVLINDPFLCKKVSKDLIDDHGIYAQPIFYPTVPKGLERLRITVTPKHRKEHIEKMIKALDTVWSKNNLPRKNINKVTANT